MELTAKQERFCREYAKDQNGTAAAIRAGYSKATAPQQASRSLKNVKIKNRVAQLLRESVRRSDISLDEVMTELKTVAFANMSDFASWTKNSVSLMAKDELDKALLAAVESVGETSGKDGSPQVRIKLHSKLRALELLIRLHEISEIEVRLAKIEEELGIS